MSARQRWLAYGSAGLLVVAGAACAALVGGVTGDALAIGLISVGLIAAVSLAFFDVGLGEDRDRAADDASRQRERDRNRALGAPPKPPRLRPRPRRRR